MNLTAESEVFIVLGLALFVIWIRPRFWLWGALVALAALIGVVSGPSEQEVRVASVFAVIALGWVVFRKTEQSLWRVERERWDEKDRR